MDIVHKKKEIKWHLNMLKEYERYKMKLIHKKDTK